MFPGRTTQERNKLFQCISIWSHIALWDMLIICNQICTNISLQKCAESWNDWSDSLELQLSFTVKWLREGETRDWFLRTETFYRERIKLYFIQLNGHSHTKIIKRDHSMILSNILLNPCLNLLKILRKVEMKTDDIVTTIVHPIVTCAECNHGWCQCSQCQCCSQALSLCWPAQFLPSIKTQHNIIRHLTWH